LVLRYVISLNIKKLISLNKMVKKKIVHKKKAVQKLGLFSNSYDRVSNAAPPSVLLLIGFISIILFSIGISNNPDITVNLYLVYAIIFIFGEFFFIVLASNEGSCDGLLDVVIYKIVAFSCSFIVVGVSGILYLILAQLSFEDFMFVTKGFGLIVIVIVIIFIYLKLNHRLSKLVG